MKVGFIGLGSMGMGAALSALRAGLTVYGVDLSPAALERLEQAGAAGVGQDASAFAGDLDAVVLLVVNAAQCRDALFGANGIAPLLRHGTPVVVSATISPDDARRFDEDLRAAGLKMLDAPVSGGAAKAETGEMTVMAAGPQDVFDTLEPLLDAIAAKVYNIGETIGLGATVKIVHQLLAGVHIAAGAEAMALASRAGIPLDLMYDVVTNAAGNSWMFENRMKGVVEGDYTPMSAVDIFVKDMGLVTETGRSLQFPLPLASTAYAMYLNASNAGYGKEADSAVIKTFAGIDLPKKKGD
ncbi:MAG TPA: NAD(P)-dependent oxidoreductase [Aurantimonas coralicida]|uniref:L-threonate dehydrogenase n=2 Tax=root TaxID=1 RepID=A0A9C9NCX2_9HYPH|nr:NAD(P)-dependent oxidoreductase [Aurantimonas coralicida]HET99481.1 NAD(P)-dependent oxidoreductase [Aurantimonas coralicida]